MSRLWGNNSFHTAARGKSPQHCLSLSLIRTKSPAKGVFDVPEVYRRSTVMHSRGDSGIGFLGNGERKGMPTSLAVVLREEALGRLQIGVV